MKGGRQSQNAVPGTQSVNLNRLGQAGEKRKKKGKKKGKNERNSNSQPEKVPGHPLQVFDNW